MEKSLGYEATSIVSIVVLITLNVIVEKLYNLNMTLPKNMYINAPKATYYKTVLHKYSINLHKPSNKSFE